ncbi:hypothetical protein [Nocardioides perillae]|uniref:Uncharacterized protein n=1 Tax=Nocardioides perillae TaxID=1119534 RepID=A0A7Y9RVI2_9ACTN|nr:hypothetical protein [Nocardioides perillae]NYG55623.1 hypothetical protein [Nocardioides perillae]
MGLGAGLRWGRGALLAAVAVGAGVLGHAGADGLLPGAPTLLLLYAAATAACTALLRHPASRRRVVALLLGGQGLVHLALTATAGHGAPAGGAPPALPAAVPAAPALPDPLLGAASEGGRRVGSLQDHYAALDPLTGAGTDAGTGEGTGAAAADLLAALAQPLGHAVGHVAHHAPMALAHLVAAVAVGLWLASGEQALATLVALARAVLGAPALAAGLAAALAAAAPPTRTRGSRPRPTLTRPRTLVLARGVPRRGPPVLLAG